MAQVKMDLRDADGGLPEVCMCCGEASDTTVTRKMSWCPPWVGVTWLAGGPILYIIIASIMTKRATVQAPLCENHQNHWFKRTIIGWASFGVLAVVCGPLLLALVVVPRDLQDTLGPFVCIGCSVLGLAWLITLIVCQSTAIRPKEITEYEITLEGVSEDFVAEMKEFERRRRVGSKKKRPVEDEDEDFEEDPKPRKKQPASESIKEARPAKKLRPAVDEDEDERPRKKQAASDGIKETRPAKKLRPAEEEDEEEQPRKKRRPKVDDDE